MNGCKATMAAALLLGGLVAAAPISASQETGAGEPLGFEDYIAMATTRDTEFEQILINELTLKYENALQLPAKDLVLSVKHQYEFYYTQDRESPDTTVGLSKLFPLAGTQISADYEVGASLSSASESSQLAVSIAQPIAENAFGRSTRLLKKIIGLEVEVASHQVVEAYEDYLAAVMTAYYTWFEDYENLLIGRSSYKENLKLLDSMNEREKQKIALPVDVNKVKIQVLLKKEQLTVLEEQYQISSNVIRQVLRTGETLPYIPVEPAPLAEIEGEFAGLFGEFQKQSRTFEILRKLERRSTLQVARDADDLLPSINIIGGYELTGDDYKITNEDNLMFAGISLEWPFPDQLERAEYEVSKILEDRQKLSSVNAYYRLYTQLANLYLQIRREKALIAIAEERIALARSILEDEQENYSFGKVTLNDYIQAFNTLDSNRFNKIAHDVEYKSLVAQWLRLNDLLVHKTGLESRIRRMEEGKE